jgi:hypothetical protein
MPKDFGPSKRKYIDENKIKARKEAEDAVPFLIEFADENDAVAYAKKWNPNLTPEEVQQIITLFRDAKRERARGK